MPIDALFDDAVDNCGLFSDHYLAERFPERDDVQTDEGERKETGSSYTPHYVVEYIVEETLGPIVDERIEQSGRDRLRRRS